MPDDRPTHALYLGPGWTPALEAASNNLLCARITLTYIAQATDWIDPDHPAWHLMWRALEEAQREEKRRAFLWRDRGGQPGWEPGA